MGYHKEEQKLVLTLRPIERSMLGIFAHLKCSSLGKEQSEGHDHRVSKADIPLGQTCHKIHQLQVDLCCYCIVSKRPKMTTWKIPMMIGGWNHQAIQAKMEKKGEIEKKIKEYCNQKCGKHQSTWLIKK